MVAMVEELRRWPAAVRGVAREEALLRGVSGWRSGEWRLARIGEGRRCWVAVFGRCSRGLDVGVDGVTKRG